MNVTEIICGHRVLVQTASDIKEHATVKDILKDGNVLVKLTDFSVISIHPMYILKDFGV